MTKLTKNIITALLVLLLAVSVWYFHAIVIYILIAVVVSILGEPLVRWFKKISVWKRKIPNSLAALLTLLIIFLVVASLFSLFIPLVIEEARIISTISAQDVLNSFREPMWAVEKYLNGFKVSGEEVSLEERIKTTLVSFLDFAKLSAVANSFIGAIGEVVVGIFSVSFISFFFLKDRDLIPSSILMLTPSAYKDRIKNIMTSSKALLMRYFTGVLIQSLSVTLMVFIGLLILGVKNALIIAFLSGVLNIIPYIGPLIAAAIGIIIGVSGNLQLDFYTEMIPFVIKITVMYGLVQFIDNILLQPFIFSNSMEAHPLEIFIVIMIAGTLAGIGGMIIAIPVYSVLRIIAKEFLSNFQIIRKLTDNNDLT